MTLIPNSFCLQFPYWQEAADEAGKHPTPEQSALAPPGDFNCLYSPSPFTSQVCLWSPLTNFPTVIVTSETVTDLYTIVVTAVLFELLNLALQIHPCKPQYKTQFTSPMQSGRTGVMQNIQQGRRHRNRLTLCNTQQLLRNFLRWDVFSSMSDLSLALAK